MANSSMEMRVVLRPSAAFKDPFGARLASPSYGLLRDSLSVETTTHGAIIMP
jgi:hypothetical protein